MPVAETVGVIVMLVSYLVAFRWSRQMGVFCAPQLRIDRASQQGHVVQGVLEQTHAHCDDGVTNYSGSYSYIVGTRKYFYVVVRCFTPPPKTIRLYWDKNPRKAYTEENAGSASYHFWRLVLIFAPVLLGGIVCHSLSG